MDAPFVRRGPKTLAICRESDMSRNRRLLILLPAVLLCLWLGAARAEGEPADTLIDIYLVRDLAVNEPYEADDRTYSREIAVPEFAESQAFFYRSTKDVFTYLVPVDATSGRTALHLSFALLDEATTASVNGEALSAERPVTVSLLSVAELRIATPKKRGLIRLKFTNLPIVSMSPDGGLYKNRDTPGTIIIVDPQYRQHGWTEPALSAEAAFSRRGKSSAQYAAKHPYNFSLMKDGEKWDKSLLGLRVDSDWLLDSAYNDASRMRNRALMDVWNEVYRLPWDRTLSGATKGVFVELFIEGTYRGLYVLGEKQDRQQLGLAKAGSGRTSLLLRTGQANNDQRSPAGFVSLGKETPAEGEPEQWYNVHIRYPQESDDYEALWQDYYDFTYLVVKGSQEEFAARIGQYVDLDNLARYYLFANAVDLTDNMRKNMTFARLDDQDERFNKFILVPWDMDSSLGRYYSSRKSRQTETVSNRLFDRLIRENPGDFRRILYEDWQALKTGALSLNGIMSHFDRYYALIHMTGADEREIAKTPKFTSYLKAAYSFTLNFERELAYIRSFTEGRLQWLDGEIEGLLDEGD
ncbi:MAG: CotH kinase family protein [Clostridia bacterium]|nr:CotH kinase family protein [Clostridia bacterium]